MTVKLIALGRPGSGKTTAVRHIINLAQRRNYSAIREKEYTILYTMFEYEQRTAYNYFRPAEYGGFDIHNFSILDVSMMKLEEKIQERVAAREHDLVTIELARDDYKQALAKFSRGFLQDAYFLFVDADIDTCIQRIHQRVVYPPIPDHHFVSDYILKTHYNVDNWAYMTHQFKKEYDLQKEIMVYRNTGSQQTFIDEVSDFAELFFDDIRKEHAYDVADEMVAKAS